MKDSSEVARLLRQVSASLAAGSIDLRAVRQVASSSETIQAILDELDASSLLRYAAIGALTVRATALLEGTSTGGDEVPLDKTWGRQSPAGGDEVPLDKTWGRQSPAGD